MSFPLSTYRLQFHRQFTFQQASEITTYLHKLGISHCYASPFLTAKPGSLHGYDIIDHSKLNPEIGTESDLENFIRNLKNHNMGLILDIVPNHMHIVDPGNRWWWNLLENGPASPYADYFDIDWQSLKPILHNKVLLPLLDQPYGKALENQSLKASYRNGAFFIDLFSLSLPTDPKSWNLILNSLANETWKILPKEDPSQIELESIITAITHLPPTDSLLGLNKEKIEERQRENEVIKHRLEALLVDNQPIYELLSKQLQALNGKKGDPRSVDLLEVFLDSQPYRLCFWRVANDEINYRRFFDIFEYAGIRTEFPEVFEATHSVIFNLIQKNFIDGLRIDHIDGLRDPEKYLQKLQEKCLLKLGKMTPEEDIAQKKDIFYIIVEKILTGNEKLRPEWLVKGTVGYDFLNQLNGIFVNQNNKKSIYAIYQNFTSQRSNIFELIYICKRLILDASLSSELYMLTRRLDHIAEQHRSSRDFTAESLRVALRDVIACFPVYRSYIRAEEGKIHEEDRQYITSAISRAKHLNLAISGFIYDFIQSVLLLEHPDEIDEVQKEIRRDFVMRFQQLTGPIMAKGLEDTANYRYFPLASLREVGADPYGFGVSVDSFHKKNLERFEFWPQAMIASSTHDTKRSEDVRARINVLSEIPEDWDQALLRWSQINQKFKMQKDDECYPDNNEEYLLYQTLIGTWPLIEMSPQEHLEYVNRIQKYIEKAIKEAKIHTSWINPNTDYDQSVQLFIQKILEPIENNPFLLDFKAFMPKIFAFGMLNSLSQLILKLTSPGVPDIYQGNEIWDFSLVDPDNRRPIDFNARMNLFKNMSGEMESNPKLLLDKCLQHPQDGRIKMFFTAKTLQLRQKLPEVFINGFYLPLNIEGKNQNHLIAFARIFEKKAVIIITARLFSTFMDDFQNYKNSGFWKECRLELPPEFANSRFRNVYTESLMIPSRELRPAISLEEALQPIPLAIFESIDGLTSYVD